MNILVYDIAAENGGAITILNWFYNMHKKDIQNKYIYLLGKYTVNNTSNITVINVPQVKKSWIHRLIFDYVRARKYLKKYHIDKVISLQNTDIPFANISQTVYVHNALPFSDFRFKFKEDKKLWIYQNLIGRRIKKSIKRADLTIVQTEWMKRSILDNVHRIKGNIEVLFPQIKLFQGIHYQGGDECIFFYPANSSKFKNHNVIFQAAKILKQRGIEEYKCIFTLHGNETEEIKRIQREAEDLNINFKWIGEIDRDEMASWYSKSILLFPSYIETIGLPIYEAKSVGAPLLLADCKYAREVVGVYGQVNFFKYNDSEKLAHLMEKKIMESRQND